MAAKPAVKWLDRRISAPGPYLCLCLTEDEYKAAFRQMGVVPTLSWIKNEHSHATAHHLTAPKGLAVVVCVRDWEKRSGVEIAGLLIHEAVHAWQEWCLHYGEETPGREQEAYAVQGIAQELMAEFARRQS